MTKQTVGIIGFGRFGKVLHRLFADEFDISVSSSTYREGDMEGVVFRSIEDTVRRSEAVFLAVPINKTEAAAAQIKPYLHKGQIVVDVCSVKETPFQILTAALKETGVHIWPTHPMFGPDSAKNGFKGLVWVSCEEAVDPAVIAPYISFLKKKGLLLYRTTCEIHDKTAAGMQGLTHLIGRYLNELDLARTPIDTLGYKRLTAVRDQTCNDTWELFYDLQRYNRFSCDVHRALENAIFKVSSQLYDETAEQRETTVIGVHAENNVDRSSFNSFLERGPAATWIDDRGRPVEIRSFNSAEAMLSKTAIGEIDGALVLIQQDNGLLALETIESMGSHPFQVIGEYSMSNAGRSVDARFLLLGRKRWTPPNP